MYFFFLKNRSLFLKAGTPRKGRGHEVIRDKAMQVSMELTGLAVSWMDGKEKTIQKRRGRTN
jgi:hypothetical protein